MSRRKTELIISNRRYLLLGYILWLAAFVAGFGLGMGLCILHG